MPPGRLLKPLGNVMTLPRSSQDKVYGASPPSDEQAFGLTADPDGLAEAALDEPEVDLEGEADADSETETEAEAEEAELALAVISEWAELERALISGAEIGKDEAAEAEITAETREPGSEVL